ncbi:MAG: hypothetical protein QM639_14325 [Rhodocyclaceae bacterium]
MPAGPISAPDAIHGILDWLSSPPAADIGTEAEALGHQLEAAYAPAIPATQFYRCIELFHARALRLANECRSGLVSAHAPPASLVNTVASLAPSLLRIAQGFERVLRDAQDGAIRTQRRLAETATARALRLLIEQYLIVQLCNGELERDFWSCAYRLFALSRMEAEPQQPPGSPAESALAQYKRLLCLGTLDVPSLAPAELNWAADYLLRAANQLHVQEERPATPDTSWHWLEPAHGAEPTAWSRTEPPHRAALLYFSTAVLARRASEALARHDAGRDRVELAPTEHAPDVQPAAVLARLRQRWTAPARRELPRRPQHYAVQACVGLPAIWQMLRAGSRADDFSTEWDVINESPGGFSIMQINSLEAGVVAGTAIALRRDPSAEWSICVVRWLRSDMPGRIEIGLQIVSQGAIPVQVGFRKPDQPTGMIEALVLPVLPALRQHQAILAPVGTYTSRRFALMSDIDRLYVAQGRLLSLDMQTSNIELFQFEIDPYPI